MTTAELEARLGVAFADRDLLIRALTHRSHAFEAGGLVPNERLEFLGDAVLGLVVTRRIYDDHPDETEGRLAKLRAATVNAASLARIARDVGLGEAVLLGHGEERSGGRNKDSILADTLEAVLGAVYLDAGLDTVTRLIERLFGDLLDELSGRGASLDYKTSLQELAAERQLGAPEYTVTDAGPDHEKTFTAVVAVDGFELGDGSGRTKKEAEQEAARLAYAALQRASAGR